MTVREALRRAEGRLRAAAVPGPALDAERLLRHVLRWTRADIVARGTESLPAASEAALLDLVEQRARRRPLQHLTGTQAFWRHEFVVTPDVLIPRPETELIVETGLVEIRGVASPVIVDVGTGTGCIALSLAAERPDAEVHAVDVSEAALTVARENARRLGVASRVHFQFGDLLEPVAALAGRVDLVASNPPYVSPDEALMPEVRDHEPALALFPPGEPYSVYRRLAPQAAATLRPGGVLLLEIGRGMEPEVARICSEAGLSVDRVVPDLQAIPRTVVARRLR